MTSETSSQLTIAASDQDHCGCYTLELQNKFGTKQASLNLTVVGMTTKGSVHYKVR